MTPPLVSSKVKNVASSVASSVTTSMARKSTSSECIIGETTLVDSSVGKEERPSSRQLHQEPSISILPGMRIHAYFIDRNGDLSTCSAEEALAKSQESGGEKPSWIDVDADDRDKEELGEWLEKLHLPPFLTMRLAEPTHTWHSQVIALRTSALVMVRILPWNPDSKDLQFLAALKSKGLLLTFTSLPRRQREGITLQSIKYMNEPERIPHGSASGALLAWLLFHVERTALFMRKIRDRTLDLDERMDENPASVPFEEIKEAKDVLLRVLSVAEEQEESVSRLKKAASDTEGLDFSKTRGTLGVILATAQSTERMGLRVEKRIGDIRAAYESYQQDRINHRLAVLTVLSAVFLPLTLMAGIWGMNFENMPELSRENAYFVALGLMGTVGVTMLFLFWQCGWFH